MNNIEYSGDPTRIDIAGNVIHNPEEGITVARGDASSIVIENCWLYDNRAAMAQQSVPWAAWGARTVMLSAAIVAVAAHNWAALGWILVAFSQHERLLDHA